jgi:molybdopterin converting factor small subunit
MEMVHIIGFGKIKKRLGQNTRVPAGQTARQAVESLQLDTSGSLPLTALVNGHVVSWEYVLQPGDELTLIPTLAGG